VRAAPDSQTRSLKGSPVAPIAVATLILVVIAGIYVVAWFPERVSLAPAVVLTAAAFVLLAINIVLLIRIRPFAWDSFLLVGKWSLLAYIVIAGMLEFVFVLDGMPANLLLLLTASLVVYAVDIPLLFAFSVAQYQPVSDSRR
jgi:hypothetical protein